MNFFEQELHKIVAPKYPDATYVGRACYVRLDELNRAKIQFVTGIVANQYHALRISILNRNEGQVDADFAVGGYHVLAVAPSAKSKPATPTSKAGSIPTSGMTTGKQIGMSTIPTTGTISSSRRRCRTIWRCFRNRPRLQPPSGSSRCK